MCQSKEDGGIRCFSHAREALSANEDKYVEMVIAKSQEVNGTQIAPAETFFGGFDDTLKLQVMLGGDTAIQNLNNRREVLADEIRATHRIIQEAVRNNDEASLVKMMKDTDPDIKAMRNRRLELIDAVQKDAANAKSDEEALEIYAKHQEESRKINQALRAADEDIKEEASQILMLRNMLNDEPIFKHPKYRTPNGIRALRKEYLDVSDKARDMTAKKTALFKKRIGGYNLKSNDDFKKVETSQALRKTDEYRSWREKNASVKMDYAITGTMMADLKTRISEEPVDTTKHIKLSNQYETLTRVRDAKIANNKKAAKAAQV